MVELVRFQSMSQKEMFNQLIRIAVIIYLNPYSSVQIIDITDEYFMNKITNVK